MPHLSTVALVAALFLSAPAVAETVCRPTGIGIARCIGPAVRPAPRPPFRSDVQALERVPTRPEAGSEAPAFVPARRTNRLGSAITDAPSGICRPDTLGNLRCR